MARKNRSDESPDVAQEAATGNAGAAPDAAAGESIPETGGDKKILTPLFATVRSKSPAGFWRLGRRWSPDGELVDLKTIGEKDTEILATDPNLVCVFHTEDPRETK